MHFESVDFVLPTYKKAATLRALIAELIAFFDDHQDLKFRAIFVLDGPDAAAEVIFGAIKDSRIVLVRLEQNLGKGAATRAALPYLEGQVVVTMDADLDIDPKSAITGIRLVLADRETSIGCVYASKFHPDSSVNYPLLRRAMSNIFRKLTKLLFDLDVTDTQTGLKVFPIRTFKEAGLACSENRFLFDLEMMVFIVRKDQRLVSMPVDLSYQYDTTISLRSMAQILVDLFLLSSRLRKEKQVQSVAS